MEKLKKYEDRLKTTKIKHAADLPGDGFKSVVRMVLQFSRLFNVHNLLCSRLPFYTRHQFEDFL